MEFQDVVRRRRMIRSYDPNRPVPPEIVDRLMRNAQRAPSAGFSQGFGFLVLDTPADIARFWAAVSSEEPTSAGSWLAPKGDPPLLIIPFQQGRLPRPLCLAG